MEELFTYLNNQLTAILNNQLFYTKAVISWGVLIKKGYMKRQTYYQAHKNKSKRKDLFILLNSRALLLKINEPRTWLGEWTSKDC